LLPFTIFPLFLFLFFVRPSRPPRICSMICFGSLCIVGLARRNSVLLL
jgi:hypothetical protein